ncbi:MAG: hypothetical protein HRF49_00635 [bacterium]
MKQKDNSHLFGDAKATARSVARAGAGDSLEDYRRAYEESKTDPDKVKAYAEALNRLNRTEEAEAVYSEYVSLVPADQDAFYELALLNKMLGKNERAIELFVKVVEMAPESPLAKSAEYEMWSLDGKVRPAWVKR